MKMKVLILFLFVGCLSCNSNREPYTEGMKIKPESEMEFDKEKWRAKEGEDYIYREKMLNDIVYNDTVRTLNRDQILNLFGEPSYYRNDEYFLYYRISERRIGSWKLHTRTMVIKLSEYNKIDWIRVHE